MPSSFPPPAPEPASAGELPKQFQLLAGKPVVEHVVDRFLREDFVACVFVALPDPPPVSLRPRDRVVYLTGGETRQQSVIRSLSRIADAEMIVVHDAVRPLFTPGLLERVVEAARRCGAALPVIPVVDTIHAMNDDATIERTLDRSRLAAAQTPQCFRAESPSPDPLPSGEGRPRRDG